MKIRIYQIDYKRDKNNFLFRNLEFIYNHFGNRFPEEIYNLIYDGETVAKNLDDIYTSFGQMQTKNCLPRHLSVSDVFEIIHTDGTSSFYFVDSIGFILIPFNKDNVQK